MISKKLNNDTVNTDVDNNTQIKYERANGVTNAEYTSILGLTAVGSSLLMDSEYAASKLCQDLFNNFITAEVTDMNNDTSENGSIIKEQTPSQDTTNTDVLIEASAKFNDEMVSLTQQKIDTSESLQSISVAETE